MEDWHQLRKAGKWNRPQCRVDAWAKADQACRAFPMVHWPLIEVSLLTGSMDGAAVECSQVYARSRCLA